ncbi:MAG TPA: hypothetical protein VNE39_25780 [Planctomycetota bacterium]|nr:hypothetical protein [Planctomycetota bacterium]
MAFDPVAMDALVRRCRESLAAGRPPLDGLSVEEAEALRTRYAAFEDAHDRQGFLVDCQVALRSLHTPRPMLHLMASSHFRDRDQWGSFWDQHAGGFSCVDSVLAGKMTSHLDTNYVPTSPQPQDARAFWVHEGGRAWPMFPLVGYEEERYRGFACRQGLDTFELRAAREGLACRLDVFVHDELPLEVWQVTLANRRRRPRDLSWFPRLRVCLDSYPAYYFVPRVVCEGIVEEGALVFLNHDQGNKHPRAAFLASATPFDGFDMMGEVFDGGPARAPIPAAVRRGACFNSLGLQPYDGLVAAAQFNAHLEAGESRTWTLVYGKCPIGAEERKEFLGRVRREALDGVEECRKRLAATWRRKVLANAVRTPDAALDRYFNVWSKLQARNQSRYVRALDKVGYRDILQDLLGICDFEAPYVRAQLATALRYQFPDGRAVRQYEKFPGGGHDLRMYQDSPSWIPDLLVRYLKETGDFAFLDEEVPFLDPNVLGGTGFQPVGHRQDACATSGTVYDHACRAVRSLSDNTGFHGLCSIGYGDWNDAISAIGGEKGVSVWLSCACVHAARLMAELAAHTGREADAAEFARIADTMTQRINAHAWDGAWYIYAINGQGVPIGSRENAEGKIHLNVNTWALFTGVAAAAGREEQVWQAIERLATPVGHLLLKPSYTRPSRPLVGRIADQLPGMFENGSIYTHGESFFLYALVCAGKADRWYEEIQKTLPCNLVPDISTTPPHQQSNFFVGPDHPAYGTNLFSNFTGSLAWYRRSIERVIGLIPEFDGLRIAPRPPRCWDHYRVTRTFRGVQLLVDVRRGGAPRVLLDGRPCPGLIPAERLAKGRQHCVEVQL